MLTLLPVHTSTDVRCSQGCPPYIRSTSACAHHNVSLTAPYAYGAMILGLWVMSVWIQYGPLFTLFGCTFTSREGWLRLPAFIRWLVTFAGAALFFAGQWAQRMHDLRNPPPEMIVRRKINDFSRRYLLSVIPTLMALVYLAALYIRVGSVEPSDPVSGLICRAISSVFSVLGY